MGAIRKESPPEHWDNSMTTRTLLLLISSNFIQTLELKGFLFSPGDDFFLMVFIQINKIVAVAGNPNKQVPVFVGRTLGFSQRLGINDVELNMVTIEIEIGPDKMGDILDAAFPI